MINCQHHAERPTARNGRSLLRATLPLLTLCGVLLASSNAEAVGTREFLMDSLSTFEGGDLTGVSIASDGSVRAGWTLGSAPIVDASSLWASVIAKDGAIILATGTEGTIYKVVNGKISVAAKTDAMVVSTLATAFGDDIICGTFPDGKLYRIPGGTFTGAELKKAWVELPDTEDIWDLAYDAKSKVLYAATGPNGKLYRITEAGKADVYFDSEEAHLVSVAVGHDGAVYAGSNGEALLYKLTGPGRVEVVYDFEVDDVKDIAIAPPDKGGAMYVIANKYNGAVKGLRPKERVARSRSGMPKSSAPAPKAPQPGKGLLMRFDSTGVAQEMLKDDKTHYVTLVLDDEGKPYVGTGAEGKVYSVDENHVEQLVADTDERQVGAMMLMGSKRYIATSDPVVFHEITGVGGADAVWTSPVQDAGLRAHFGLLQWRAEGQLELQTRSGNTKKPDDSWSQWSAALTKPAKIVSPPARYLQVRARWSREPKAVLNEVKISFVTDNARALITSVTAGDARSSSSGSSIPTSGGPLDKPSTSLKLSWKVENPDNDKMRYRAFYRPIDGTRWYAIMEPDEEHTSTSYSWNTTGLPEGEYRVRVDSSDELSNPPGRVTKHSLESRTILIDNTPPVLSKLTLKGTKLQGTVQDGGSPVGRIEFALLGGKTFYPIFPTDQVFDQKTESFDVDIAGLVPPGTQHIIVQAYDSAGNVVTRTVATAP